MVIRVWGHHEAVRGHPACRSARIVRSCAEVHGDARRPARKGRSGRTGGSPSPSLGDPAPDESARPDHARSVPPSWMTTRLPVAAAPSAYGVVAITLHWLLAALIVAASSAYRWSTCRFRRSVSASSTGTSGSASPPAVGGAAPVARDGHPPPRPAGMPSQVTAFASRTWLLRPSSSCLPVGPTPAVGVPVVFPAGCRCPTSFRATRLGDDR